MHVTYFDADIITEKKLATELRRLSKYRDIVREIAATGDASRPEYALAAAKDPALHVALAQLAQHFKKCTHVVLVGIGGSSLGLEAIHAALPETGVKLHVLDTVSATTLTQTLALISNRKRVTDLAVCIISKSGTTTETLANAQIVLKELVAVYGKSVYSQCIAVGDAATPLMQFAKRHRMHTVAMPAAVGGRYSVATAVGLVPLTLLRHDVDTFIDGVVDAITPECESVAAEDAARVYRYLVAGAQHYNFFAFEPRLASLGAWYRQLMAESLGKAETRSNKPLTIGCIPTISTPVELHSIGQLYLSGFPGVYTDFVSFDDDTVDFPLSRQGLGGGLGGHTIAGVAAALYGGVVAAYQERQLPYRATVFADDLSYSLGLFMGMRMLETMYIAELMDVSAFDQPNVELYKQKTKAILGI
jgi:glucose-6-phosphate isomerase